jgi:hypothetical protein
MTSRRSAAARIYFRSLCTRFSRSSRGSTSPSEQRSVRVSTASSSPSRMASETPSWSARRMRVSRLVRSVVASTLRAMPVTGCSRISASSDGVKFLLYCFLFMPSIVAALAQGRDARRRARKTRACKRQQANYDESPYHRQSPCVDCLDDVWRPGLVSCCQRFVG